MASLLNIAGNEVSYLYKSVVGWAIAFVMTLMLMKIAVPSAHRFKKNRQTSNLIGKDKEHWFWGGAIKVRFNSLF